MNIKKSIVPNINKLGKVYDLPLNTPLGKGINKAKPGCGGGCGGGGCGGK